MPNPRASGARGSWFAEVLGESLPCIHDHWLKRMHYTDPDVELGKRQWDDYIAAIKEKKKVILTHDKRDERGVFQRDGYVAVFEVANVAVTGAGLEMDLVKRIHGLA